MSIFPIRAVWMDAALWKLEHVLTAQSNTDIKHTELNVQIGNNRLQYVE